MANTPDITLKILVLDAPGHFRGGTVDVEFKHRTVSDHGRHRGLDASREINIAGLRRAPTGDYQITVIPTDVFKPQSQFVNIPASGFATMTVTIERTPIPDPQPPQPDPNFVVKGTVRSASGTSSTNRLVRAIHQQAAGDVVLLGKGTTDDQGNYLIRYSSEQVRGAINLRVQLFDGSETVMAQSESRNPAKREEVVDLTVQTRVQEFTVTGAVRQPDGSSKKQQRLVAFDLDLRGVAVYRTAKTLAEIEAHGGFEFLGVTTSDNRGDYSVTFFDWQYRGAERKQAEVVVYAVDYDKDRAIIGRSRMVNTEDYSDQGLVRNLNVIITEAEKRAEYEALMSALNAFLKESEVSLREIAASRDQLTVTASELDLDLAHIQIAARAELLRRTGQDLSHELLYGIGRQNIRLDWAALAKKHEEDLRAAIAKSTEEKIIRVIPDPEIKAFLLRLHEIATQETLIDKQSGKGSVLNDMLSYALPKESQRLSFLNAFGTFKGADFREFWNEHLPAQPEFKGKPELVANLLLTQQLMLLTGDHQPLVKELQVNRKISSPSEMLDLEHNDWVAMITKSGVPDFVTGSNDKEKIEAYAERVQSVLNAAYPTQRIARMVEKKLLPIEQDRVSKGITGFLAATNDFDFSTSRIHDFDEEIRAVTNDSFPEVRSELMKLQRVYQVSINPESMAKLLENQLFSAYTIANIPRASFIKTYAQALGGEQAAFAIHERASHISTQTEFSAMEMMEYSRGDAPRFAFAASDPKTTRARFENLAPDFSQLFGSLDICECEECRSVHSAAAYFVDLLRFLSRSTPNAEGRTPLQVLAARRPDLLHLPLTCENTNTIIPYIDLATEVMEHYAANASLTNFTGFDTGETTTQELRANAQNFNLDAYRRLSNARYPFTLPYHQPLDVIRIYSDHLGVNRYRMMRAANPNPALPRERAIDAESLLLSEEEFKILTGEPFAGGADTTRLPNYFGFDRDDQLENLSRVPEFLQRSGMAYVDLVELLKTKFINPHQSKLDFLERFLAEVSLAHGTTVETIYAQLVQVEAGTLDPAADRHLTAALNAYNARHGTTLSSADFAQWITLHLRDVRQVITLFEPHSACSLDTTALRTIQSIYEHLPVSGLARSWSRIHRFIRLWRKLGCTVHETDLLLAAIGGDITAAAIHNLSAVSLLAQATRLPYNKLAVLWADIDTYGNKSLYKALFLNKAVQQNDEVFRLDASDDYLRRGALIFPHQSAILAAFRITEDELNAILRVARVIDGGGVQRQIHPTTDALNLLNLSAIYRHVLLAKALNMRIIDLCTLIDVFDGSPFIVPLPPAAPPERFTNVAPWATYEFYNRATSVKEAGFEAPVLEYILRGTLPPDSRIGLSEDKSRQTARVIRESFAAIEQDHPSVAPTPLTPEIITAKLALTFQPEIVSRFMGILQNKSSFETRTEPDLDIVIPNDEDAAAIAGLIAAGYTAKDAVAFLRTLSTKYTYVKHSAPLSGRLTCAGTMTDRERDFLKALLPGNARFANAIDELYDGPEKFISKNFKGVFANLAGAAATIPPETFTILLDHPATAVAGTLDDKLNYVYRRFIPLLKSKLRRDAITQHIAALIGLSNEATALLIAEDVDTILTDLSTAGFSANYFDDATHTHLVHSRTDEAVDFAWGNGAPSPSVPADNFSVRWETFIVPPASGEYTLVVEVGEADEVFRLYLDDTLLWEKTAADVNTSKEVLVSLNASRMHSLKLEYAEISNNASVRLQWKTNTKALEVIPSSAAYPAAVLDSFAARARLYHRAASFILGFKLTETELNHFISHAADFGDIDFKALTAKHWRRISDYTALRNAVPQALALLTDVFALANRRRPAPTVPELRALLHRATAWDLANLDVLITRFGSSADNFKNEISLKHLREVMSIVQKTGLTAATVLAWGTAETSFDALHVTAQSVKNRLKSKYEAEDWLDVAGNLSNRIRENQKQALVAYLLTLPSVQAAGAKDADGLFEYLLIDVQMGACMDTSRIVQANSSVQMFVNRCLLNLESETTSGSERGVSPGAIDTQRWEWMKNYRVWEANRKVFLYPENWLEPEWRNDRSDFFKDLESYLVQNDITDRSVEQAFRNYLGSLSEVANLEVCGIEEETNAEGQVELLHIFARTHNAPYKFFYRTWNNSPKFSAWQKVPVDIRCVEDGATSGVHLLPVVWKKRLFLFWPEFVPIQDSPPMPSGQSTTDAAAQPMSRLAATQHWEIRLAWSEYVEGKWSPKQLSKEFITQSVDSLTPNEASIRLVQQIDSHDRLQIALTINFSGWFDLDTFIDSGWSELNSFILSDIASKIETGTTNLIAQNAWTDYSPSFLRLTKSGPLHLLDDDYLLAPVDHQLLVSPLRKNFVPTLKDPFFFSDALRTYFVRPVEISVTEALVNTYQYTPYLAGLSDNRKYQVPFVVPIPAPGPDDYLPPGIQPDFAVAIPRQYFGTNRNAKDLAALGISENSILASGSNVAIAFTKETRSAGSSISSPAAGANRMLSFNTPASFSNVHLVKGGERQSTSSANEVTYINRAFAGGQYYVNWGIRTDRGLEFHTFYHPYSAEFVTRLNEKGLPGLMKCDTTIRSDNGTTFETNYGPNFTNGLVQKPPADFATRTYYKENVCFDDCGANSLYNWELFFHAPLYIANRLSKNGKYREAMDWFHYIFDPTTDELPGPGESEISRYWKVVPFKTTTATTLEEWFRTLAPSTSVESPIIKEWRKHPFDPHLVASRRPLAYMKNVVIKYVENLVAWGDSLFRQDTMESANEALQLYVIANHILGPRPQFVPKRGEIKAQSYESLKDKWDDFSNALVELENIFPYSSTASVSNSSTGTSLLGLGPALYFCIPPNKKLVEYWDLVADRLFKIRHCQNIDGVERHLALFAPPIDPAALIQATSQGLSLGSILADLSSPPPIHRFSFLLQKANEFCADVKGLGAALLSVLEKKDAEELSRLRAAHETQMLELMTAIRERQVLDAKAGKDSLLKARETATFRLQHYIDLLGNDSVTIPDAPAISATLTAHSQLPADTNIPGIETDVDDSLAAGSERGVKLIPREADAIARSMQAARDLSASTSAEILSGFLGLIPDMVGRGTPVGIGAGFNFGGRALSWFAGAMAKQHSLSSQLNSMAAASSVTIASYIRREQDWTLQANLAAREIVQLDKQITSAEIKVQVAEKELRNHKQQIENSKDVELFLQGKFSNQELYQWMKEQLFAVCKQSYDLAYDMAKKAEKAYKYELGTETASFIRYGYWDNSTQGLVSGEKLQLALRQLEKSYLEENRRELELTKNVSLARLNPLALIQLRETGKCFVSVPEELFDLDFRGHYFRRLKAVRLSIPCVAGPYTSVSCSLRLLNNSVRINTAMNSETKYEHEHDLGVFIDDDRFRTQYAPVTAIATSQAQNDSGMFEFNFRDERFLPFERAGAISEWQIALSEEKELRQFNYSTISDVILHLNYTARESGGLFKEKATTHMRDFLLNASNLADQPLLQMFNLKHDFSTEWYKFLHPGTAEAAQELKFTVGKERFPFFVQDRGITIMKIELFARCTHAGDYFGVLSYNDFGGHPASFPEITMGQSDAYGGLNKGTIAGAGLNPDQLDITKELTLRVNRHSASETPPVVTPLATNPDEIEEFFMVFHYKLTRLAV